MIDHPLKKSFSCVGRPVPRVDALDKVLGRAVYAEDISFPNLLHGRVLRSRFPHAVIERIDTTAAREIPGVVCVLTAKDVPGENRFGLYFQDHCALAEDRVISTGDPVAIVAAETEEIARDAVKAVEVTYRALPVLTNPHAALAEGAPAIHGKGNVLMHNQIRKGNPEEGFSRADVIVENTYRTQVVDHCYLETESGVGTIDERGNLVIWSANQCPYRDRRQVAKVLGIPENRIRMIRATTGGAFGGKDDVSVEVHIGLLVKATRRPVRLVLDREESLATQTKRHAMEIRTRWGATREGKLTAMEGKVYGDTGAYAGLGAFVVRRCGIFLGGPYFIPHVAVDIWSVYTNNIIASAMRGFGVVQAAVAHEGQMDELAARLGIHPLRLRIMNALKPGLSTATGQVLKESVGIGSTLGKIRETILGDDTLRNFREGLE